jgi:hypothetical protein
MPSQEELEDLRIREDAKSEARAEIRDEVDDELERFLHRRDVLGLPVTADELVDRLRELVKP